MHIIIYNARSCLFSFYIISFEEIITRFLAGTKKVIDHASRRSIGIRVTFAGSLLRFSIDRICIFHGMNVIKKYLI